MSTEIIIKTQAKLDALPLKFDEYTVIRIEGGTKHDRIIIRSSYENGHAELCGNSHAELCGNSHAELCGNSHAVLWENSHAVLWENSHAVLRGNSVAHVHSASSVDLFGFAVAILLTKIKIKITHKSKTTAIIRPKKAEGNDGWLESQGIEKQKGFVTLFKRVSLDFKTQEGTSNETDWRIDATVTHKAWSPKEEECGAGKFHACSRPYFCDGFRSTIGDKYIAIKIATKDLHAWPHATYPHKIAFRQGVVLFECDHYGNKLSK